MPDKIVRPEHRRTDGRQGRLSSLGDAVSDGGLAERRVHCWDLDSSCTEERRRRCSAHFVKRNCWDLWAAEYFPPGRKPCCHPDLDCAQCPVALAKFGAVVSVYVEVPATVAGSRGTPVESNRLPTYCPFLYSSKEGAGPYGEGEGRTAFHCQRRRGVQLHSSYVSEVCGSPSHRECTFYAAE